MISENFPLHDGGHIHPHPTSDFPVRAIQIRINDILYASSNLDHPMAYGTVIMLNVISM